MSFKQQILSWSTCVILVSFASHNYNAKGETGSKKYFKPFIEPFINVLNYLFRLTQKLSTCYAAASNQSNDIWMRNFVYFFQDNHFGHQIREIRLFGNI